MKDYVFLVFFYIFLSFNSYAKVEKPRDVLNEICGIAFNKPINEFKKQFDNLKLTDSKLIKNLYSTVDDQLLIYSNQDIDLGILEIKSLKKSFLLSAKIKSKRLVGRIKIGDSVDSAKKTLRALPGKLFMKKINELRYEDSQSSSTTQQVLVKFAKNRVSVLE
ncbi:MAG TPA: hypothetical protein VNJ08_06765 [Bacteriovoracaceae bacterium]|nr:hypothetical protein [Bacteriovoracaceae bacterium]